MPDCLAERVGLSRPLCGLLANMPLRGCVGRTGFEGPYRARSKCKRPHKGAFHILAVERVLRGGYFADFASAEAGR